MEKEFLIIVTFNHYIMVKCHHIKTQAKSKQYSDQKDGKMGRKNLVFDFMQPEEDNDENDDIMCATSLVKMILYIGFIISKT